MVLTCLLTAGITTVDLSSTLPTGFLHDSLSFGFISTDEGSFPAYATNHTVGGSSTIEAVSTVIP